MAELASDGLPDQLDVFDGLLAKAGLDAGLVTVRSRIPHAFARVDLVLDQEDQVEVGPTASTPPLSGVVHPGPTTSERWVASAASDQSGSRQTVSVPPSGQPATLREVIREITTERLKPGVSTQRGELDPSISIHTERVIVEPGAHVSAEPAPLTSSTPLLIPPAAPTARVAAHRSEPLRVASPKAGAPQRAEPTVTVSIGRLEVTAAGSASKPQAKRPAKSSPRVSLDEFLGRDRAT